MSSHSPENPIVAYYMVKLKSTLIFHYYNFSVCIVYIVHIDKPAVQSSHKHISCTF